MNNFHQIIDFVKSQFPNQEIISLHEPKFIGKEKEYVCGDNYGTEVGI